MHKNIPMQWKNGRPIPVFDTDLADFPGEQWKAIPGFEDHLASNYGRVKSVARYVIGRNGKEKMVKEKIIRPNFNKVRVSSGSISISLLIRKDGKRYYFSVARLVYHLFVSPIEMKNQTFLIRKKDKDYLNCYYGNLELKLISEVRIETTLAKKTARAARFINGKGLLPEPPPKPTERPIPVLNTDLCDLPQEQWKDIPGYEDYRISNYGRAKSVARYITAANGEKKWAPEKIIKLYLYKTHKTTRISLRLITGNKEYYHSVQKLVYHLFVSPIDMNSKTFLIRKKDNDPLNCYYENLELRLISEVRIETTLAKRLARRAKYGAKKDP